MGGAGSSAVKNVADALCPTRTKGDSSWESAWPTVDMTRSVPVPVGSSAVGDCVVGVVSNRFVIVVFVTNAFVSSVVCGESSNRPLRKSECAIWLGYTVWSAPLNS